MSDYIKLIKPYISFDEISIELQQIFDSGQLTKGLHADKFIESLTEYTNCKHAFLTTSATTALTMCLKSIGVKEGDKVAVSDFSFPATANAVEDLGAIPVFIDVDKDTYNMSVDALRAQIDTTFKALIFVDALGSPSGLDKIKTICKEFSVPLIEDAACALGSSFGDEKVGAIADLTCFSFHPRKLLTTGEGGAILTGNDEYAHWLKMKLNHGALGMKGKGLDFIEYGYNYRMSEIQALMGWKQVLKLDEIMARRHLIANEYENKLEPLGFKRQAVTEGVYHNIQSLVFTVPAGVSRDHLIDYLAEKNVETTLGTYSISATTYYKKKYNCIQPNSYWLEQNTITLPCYDDLDVLHVINSIHDYLR